MPRSTLRVALYQADTVVGDIEGNTERLLSALQVAESAGADVLAGPELVLTGYPPEDLLLKPGFVAANLVALQRVARRTTRCAALVGFVAAGADGIVDGALGDGALADGLPAGGIAGGAPGNGVPGNGALDDAATSDAATSDAATSDAATSDAAVGGAAVGALGTGRMARAAAVRGAPRQLRNALACCAAGRVQAVVHKRRLPNYGVFDEARWFAPGSGPLVLVEVAGVLVGMSVCEDLWFSDGPVPDLGRGGAQLVVNVNASPFAVGRIDERLQVLRERASAAGCPIVYVNQVGGQDELVFDGGSMVVDASGAVVAAATRFAEDLLLVDVAVPARVPTPTLTIAASGLGPAERPRGALPPLGRSAIEAGLRGPLPSAAQALGRQARGRQAPGTGGSTEEEEVYAALVLGTRDYLGKNGFTDAVIGLSGGIDSSLVAAVAVDALGADRVHGVAMPSRYSSEGSVGDARELAQRLGMVLDIVPIEPAHRAMSAMLAGAGCTAEGLTDENLQSRIRGVVLMALSNARGWLVLTTGNKSELATGYSTLYGDTAGGFAVIKDVPKTMVYRLCRYRNAVAATDVVPASVLDKPPSAELRPDQRDDQSLPPYEVLDPVLAALVEEDRPLEEMVDSGIDPELVERIARMVDLAEYKRRQSPIGIRITPRAFGKDRRMPITHRFRESLTVPARPAMASLPPASGPPPGDDLLGHVDPGRHGQ